MTRQEYLAELESHLSSLPKEEIDMAVRFYEEYFEDAGVENEQSVMDDLGKPYALAKSIICEESAYSKSISYAKYRESKSLAAGSPFVSGQPIDTAQDVASSSQPAAPHTQYTTYNYSYNNAGAQAAGTQEADAQPAEPQQSASQNAEAYGQQQGGFNYNGAADRMPNGAEAAGSYEEYKNGFAEEKKPEYTADSGDSGANGMMLLLGLFLLICIGLPVFGALIFFFAACGIAAIAFLVVAIVGLVQAFLCGSLGMGIATAGASIFSLGLTFLLTVPTVVGFAKAVPAMIKATIKFFKKYSGGAR